MTVAGGVVALLVLGFAALAWIARAAGCDNRPPVGLPELLDLIRSGDAADASP